jgi:rhodanese-related sulfurtransferase
MLKSTVIPAIAIVVLSALLGLGFNAVRAKNRIEITRNYFRIAAVPTDPPVVDAGRNPTVEPSTKGDGGSHPFTVVTTDEALELSEDGGRYSGEIIFVDARNDAHYEEGHIPGAYQIDHYNLDDYIDEAMLARLDGADIIVVYCGGGDCEDSIYLSSALLEFDVSIDKIRLYESGMAAWTEQGLPVDEGRE